MKIPHAEILYTEIDRAEALVKAHRRGGKKLSARASALYSRLFELSEDAACGMPIQQEDARLAATLAAELSEVLSNDNKNVSPDEGALVRFQKSIPTSNAAKMLLPLISMPFVAHTVSQKVGSDAATVLAFAAGFFALVIFAVVSAGVILEGGRTGSRRVLAGTVALIPVLVLILSVMHSDSLGGLICAGFVPVALLGLLANSENYSANDSLTEDAYPWEEMMEETLDSMLDYDPVSMSIYRIGFIGDGIVSLNNPTGE